MNQIRLALQGVFNMLNSISFCGKLQGVFNMLNSILFCGSIGELFYQGGCSIFVQADT